MNIKRQSIENIKKTIIMYKPIADLFSISVGAALQYTRPKNGNSATNSFILSQRWAPPTDKSTKK